MFSDSNLLTKLYLIILLLFLLKTFCERICVPPKDKSMRKYFNIVPASGLIQRFCVCKDVRYVDEKEFGYVTTEGVFCCTYIITIYVLYIFYLILCDFQLYHFFITSALILVVGIFEGCFHKLYVWYWKRRFGKMK